MRKPAITLADRARHLRIKLDLTQLELAKKSGVTPETISRLERGKSQGAVASLGAIARALGTTVDSLIGKAPVVGKSER